MTYIPDPDPTPLRLRLGHRADTYWQPLVESTLSEPTVSEPSMLPVPIVETPATPAVDVAPATHATSETRPLPRWSERLDEAIAQTDARIERWVADQQTRLLAGLDLMLSQLKEQRREEASRLEAWKISERERVERDLAVEEDRFHAKLMNELTAFEEQLALRLVEQEERLKRWWDEAEDLAQKRFADLGIPTSGK